ncbi:FAD-binding oxidoreductase [soil metagenome]
MTEPTPASTGPDDSPVDPQTLRDLAEELRGIVGPDGVSDDPAVLARVSVDEATMSPILRPRIPSRTADLHATPRSAEQIAQVVGAAVRHGVPVTVRGRGTGNYGQGIPLRGGLLLETTRAKTIVELAEGRLLAEAGARMIDLERAARESGQQLWMYPSTVQSSLGGFLAGGSGGTGSLTRGWIEDGFVRSLDVAHATGQGELTHIDAADVLPYLHAYGTTGVIAAAEVALEPALDWVSVWASIPDFRAAQRALLQVTEFDPAPRIASTDMAAINESFPPRSPVTSGQASFRAVVVRSQLPQLEELVERAGGRIEEVREGLQAVMAISLLSYNHPLWHMIRATGGEYFHVETGGMALVDAFDDVIGVFPGAVMHLDASVGFPIGMVGAPFESEEAVEAGVRRLQELGLFARSPHHWTLDRRADLAASVAALTDPHGLLNPGKLPA